MSESQNRNLETRAFPSITPGQMLGDRYQILQEINPSGQWEVYLAQEVVTQKKVIIKFWRLFPDSLIQYQSKLEARLFHLRNLQHPGILEILDYRFQYNRFYVVQEFASGITLRELLNQHSHLPVSEVTKLLIEILNIVQYLHYRHLLHLDINPNKIFCVKLPNGLQIVKLDAIGQILPDDLITSSSLQQKYRAPEVHRPDVQLGPSSDIYSIGILAYEMLTGVLPYPPYSLLTRDAAPLIPPLSRMKPSLRVPSNVEHSIRQAIAWKARNRFETAGEFLHILTTKSHFPQENFSQNIFKLSLIVLVAAIFYGYYPQIVDWVKIQLKDLQVKIQTFSSKKSTNENEFEIKIPKNVLPQRPMKLEFEKQIEKYQAQKNADELYKNMCLIPEGVVPLENFEENGKLEKIVKVPEFYIDRTEVTNSEYQEFVKAVGHSAPEYWKEGKFIPSQENYPVVCVNWYSAKLYAIWRGKRLPSEIEWERAAHGEQYKRWPWGNAFASGFANVESQSLEPVGKFPYSPSIFGLLDMSGNVWEWTDSWYQKDQDYDKVIRGGSYRSKREQATTNYREGFFPESYRDDIGFRCVKDSK